MNVNDICLRHTQTHRHTHTHIYYIVTHMHTVNSANERTLRPIVGARSRLLPSLPPGDPTWEVDEVRRSVPDGFCVELDAPVERTADPSISLRSWSAPLLTSTAVIAPAPGTSRTLPHVEPSWLE